MKTGVSFGAIERFYHHFLNTTPLASSFDIVGVLAAKMTAVWNLWALLVILLAELGKKFTVNFEDWRANLTTVDVAHSQITIYGISALEMPTTTSSVYTPIVSATTNFYIGGVNTEGATTVVEEIIYSLVVVTNPTSTSTVISKLDTGYVTPSLVLLAYNKRCLDKMGM